MAHFILYLELLTEAQQAAKQSHNEAEQLRSKFLFEIHVFVFLFFDGHK